MNGAYHSQIHNNDSSYITNKSGARAGGYMSTQTEKVYAKPAPAGILNSKTLAEENLKGFRLRNLQKESDLPLRVNQPQRIELPIYFNTPKRKEDIILKKRLTNNAAELTASVLKNNSGLNMAYADSYNRIAAQKRLKDYNILAFACKRAGKSRDEGRAYYSTGVLFDNLGKYKQAIEQYKRFL